MRKILLVQCPCSFGNELPPLGLGYLSAFLKKNNYDVFLLDFNIILYKRVSDKNKDYWDINRGYYWYLLDLYKKLPFIKEEIYKEYADIILSAGIDIIGFSVQSTSAVFTLEIIKRVKSLCPSKKIILGGPNCYNVERESDIRFRLPHDLQEFADVVIVGEGEQTLLNVISSLHSQNKLDECKGIAIPKGTRYIFNGFAAPISNLDDLPFPDLDVYDLNAYTNKNSLPIITSRGCVMKCVFCTDTNFWGTYRYRSAKNVLAEIILRQEKYDRHLFNFNDSLINGSYRKLLEMCNMLVQNKIDIRWGGNCRIDRRLDVGLLEKMKKAGCSYLNLGIESGSNKILRLMRKNFTIEEADNFIHYSNEIGIDIIANWVVGFPGETAEDFMATVNFITEHAQEIKKNTFSTLTINQFSYLETHKEEFGVVIDTPHLGLWYSKDGSNTIDIRNSRLQDLQNLEIKRGKDCNVVRQL